jgi:hypothetical protein
LTAIILPISNEEKQALLSTASAPELLKTEYRLLRYETHIMQLLANEPPAQEGEPSPFSLN